jgi:hypothetical protein
VGLNLVKRKGLGFTKIRAVQSRTNAGLNVVKPKGLGFTWHISQLAIVHVESIFIFGVPFFIGP